MLISLKGSSPVLGIINSILPTCNSTVFTLDQPISHTSLFTVFGRQEINEE